MAARALRFGMLAMPWRRARCSLAAAAVVAAGLACPVAVADSDDLGRKIFAETAVPPCAVCHTLKAANSAGEIGPNLDELKPDAEKVARAVRNGVGNMPAFGEALSDAEIAAVAAFVAKAAAAGD